MRWVFLGSEAFRVRGRLLLQGWMCALGAGTVAGGAGRQQALALPHVIYWVKRAVFLYLVVLSFHIAYLR